MNQTVARHNDYYAISRGKGARKQVTASSQFMQKFILVIVTLLCTILLYQYLHTQITVIKSQIATGQKRTQELLNQERFLTQELESLRHPQRIEQLATALGMFPPREMSGKKFYHVRYASLSHPKLNASSATIQTEERKGLGTLVAKLVTYYQRAEAKPNKQ